jgi:hypothetical protein
VNSAQEKSFSQGRGLIALWVGFLAAPLIWFVNLQLNYMLVPWACTTGRQYPLVLVTAGALLLVVGAGGAAWYAWRQAGQEWPDSAGGIIPRSRFLAVLGLFTCGLFFLVILAQGVPTLVLSACQP